MTKQELIEFLKDNLTIHIDTDRGMTSDKLIVRICLDRETISRDYLIIPQEFFE